MGKERIIDDPKDIRTLGDQWAYEDTHRPLTKCWHCRFKDKDFNFGEIDGKCAIHPDGIPRSKIILTIAKDYRDVDDIDKYFKEHICGHFEPRD